MSSFKHLSLEDRISIQSGLHDHLSFKKIGTLIAHDCTTVSKEVRNHASIVDDMWPANRRHNRCVHYKDCSKKHICKFCTSSKNVQCRYCNQVSCPKVCPDYREERCDKLNKPPYVCNGCLKLRRCPLQKKIYDAKDAQLDYERTLSDSRSGAMISDGELSELDALISPLIQKGQSFYHILINHPDQINWSSKTLYNYIHLGLLQARPIDLPRAVRRKPKVRKSVHHKVDSKCRIGRTIEDYHSYMTQHPDAIVCQMDTVEGRKGGKCILTLFFPDMKFQIGFLRDHNDARSVTLIFQQLREQLEASMFHHLFDVILTDNGTEFSNPSAIEAIEDDNIHPHVFYCDPNRSDQKGGCENDHSNFRRIVPKGTDMDGYPQELIDQIFSHVNSLSRSSLNGRSPYESFRFRYGKKVLDKLHIKNIQAEDVTLKPSLIVRFFKEREQRSK